jgi:hypothetical protein
VPQHVIVRILPIKWHPIHIEIKCELLYGGQDLPKVAVDLRCGIYLPIEGFAIDVDMETEFPNTPLFVITCVYGGTSLVDNDSGNETSKLFSPIDEFNQVREGKGEFKK